MKNKRHMMVAMCVIDKDETILKQTPMNMMDPGARKVISRTMWWAMNNGHEIALWPMKPGEKLEKIDSRKDNRHDQHS